MGWEAKVRGTVTLKCAGHTGMHLQSYRDKPEIPDITETNRETLENCLKGAKGLTGQLRRLHTRTCSVGSREEELEATVLLESYDPVAISGQGEWVQTVFV